MRLGRKKKRREKLFSRNVSDEEYARYLELIVAAPRRDERKDHLAKYPLARFSGWRCR